VAEKQESSADSLKKAVQSYLAALNFLQVYRGVFLEDSSALDLDDEERLEELRQVDEKSKFAKWRVIEIKKQLLSLNTPSSPVPTLNNTASNQSLSNIDNTTYTSPPILGKSPPQMNLSNTVASPSLTPQNVLLYDPKVLGECERHARHAISALHFDDIETAAENLQIALNTLKPLLMKK
jgi:hypothetical protein